MKNVMFKTLIAILIYALISMGCGANRTIKGGAIGASLGGLIGGIIGKQKKETAKGAIIGAAVGGTAGALIGRYMDKQAEELQRDLEGTKIERIGEGIKITFDSGILFAVDSSEPWPESDEDSAEAAREFQKTWDALWPKFKHLEKE